MAKIIGDVLIHTDKAVQETIARDAVIPVGGLATAQIADLAVTTAKIAAANVTAAKIAYFKSTEQTGTGSSQDIAHGLVTTPSLVLFFPTLVGVLAPFTLVEGTHDATNIKVTVISGAKFYVIAIK